MLHLWDSISGLALAPSLAYVTLAALVTVESTLIPWNGDSSVQFRYIQKEDGALSRFRRDTPSCSQPSPTRTNTTHRLERLRNVMITYDYDAYIVPSGDEHQSEYVADHDKRREYITGFSGSAGVAVVTRDKAALWTDGRYYIQAVNELDCNWILMVVSDLFVPTIPTWLNDTLNSDKRRVGIDSRLISHSLWSEWEEDFKVLGNIQLIGREHSLIDDIWTRDENRPSESTDKIFVHDVKYAGKKWEAKVTDLRNQVKRINVYGVVVSALDDIAWLFNLRGSDIPYNPVFKAYAFVTQDLLRLYVNLAKMTPEVEQHLHPDGCNITSMCVKVLDYSLFFEDMQLILKDIKRPVLVPKTASHAVYNLIPEHLKVVRDSPIMLMKTVKNPTEIKGMKNAYLRDSIAVIEFLAMLEKEVTAGVEWDELKAAKALHEIRAEDALNRGESFKTISAFGSNAAIPHYSPQPSTNKTINVSSVYLLDSGGQYLDGTVDTTRTLHFGTPTHFQKEAYTRVLMGFIDTASLVFPEGTRDTEIDMIPRMHLHRIGLDYFHGTGHGIGSFLGVHEAPILITLQTPGHAGSTLQEGMFTSIEPGYYEEGEFGIRLETVVVVTKAETKYQFGGRRYMKFEPIALVPFEPKLILEDLLNDNQIEWLNNYHAQVRDVVGKVLLQKTSQRSQDAYDWLMQRTKHVFSPRCTSRAISLQFPLSFFYTTIAFLQHAFVFSQY